LTSYRGARVFQGLGIPPPCRDYFFDDATLTMREVTPDGDRVVQDGKADVLPDVHVQPYADRCPPRLLLRQAGKAVLLSQDPADPRKTRYSEPDDASTELHPYVAPAPGLVEKIFQTGQKLYWMDGDGGRCIGHRVASLRAKRDPTLADDEGSGALDVFVAQEAPAGAHWGLLIPLEKEPDGPITIPFLLVPGGLQPAVLLLGTEQQPNGYPKWKCRCERLLRAMAVVEDELDLLGRTLPSDRALGGFRQLPGESPEILAYDERQVERWFRTKERCETVRRHALELVHEDGRRGVQQGFHAAYHL
jgi:hypothetical protein